MVSYVPSFLPSFLPSFSELLHFFFFFFCLPFSSLSHYLSAPSSAGSDYDAVDSQAVEFLSGDAASFIRQISVTITNDNAVEGTESFSLTLSSGDPNAVLVDTTATVTILDDATDSESLL